MDSFLDVIKESRKINQIEKKEYNKVHRKEIIKQRLVQLYLTGLYNNRQIADILSISESSVKKMLRMDDVKEQLALYQAEEKEIIDAKIKALRNKAVDTLADLLNSDEDNVKLNVVKDILDRTGHAKKNESEVNVNVTYEQKLQQLAEGVDTSFIDTSYTVEDENG